MLKLGITMALLIAIAIVVAMLVSSYLSAYKTGQGVKNHNQAGMANKAARKATPLPTVMPQNASMPGQGFTRQQYPAAQPIQPPLMIQEAMPQRLESPSVQPAPTPSPTSEPLIIAVPRVPNAPCMGSLDIIQWLYWIMAIVSRQYPAFPPWLWWP